MATVLGERPDFMNFLQNKGERLWPIQPHRRVNNFGEPTDEPCNSAQGISAPLMRGGKPGQVVCAAKGCFYSQKLNN